MMSAPTLPPPSAPAQLEALAHLIAVAARLRHPETGCPWDLKQTHATLRPYLLEEAYEAVSAMSQLPIDTKHLCEELGDVLLQVVLNARIAEDEGTFDLGDIAQGLADKLIRRHPHVFGETAGVDTPEAVTAQWQAIKAQEKSEKPTEKTSVLDGVAHNVPALLYALAISKRAVKVGFEWPDFASLWACVESELIEVQQAVEAQEPQARLEEEIGDLLFASVNLARHLKVDPEVALTVATEKFSRRFRQMEAMAEQPLESLSFEQWDALWNQAKATLKSQNLA